MAISVVEAKDLICELCRLFYDQGWVGGTGGGISVRAGDQIVMAPSGVQKERMQPQDMFVLDSAGSVVESPAPRPPPHKSPKLSECSPLFMAAYELRGAGAVMHSHSINSVLATMLDPDATEFKVTQLEMIKGLEGHGFYDELVVPIIENTARECELTDRLRQAIQDYPKTCAVLVRRHGVYIWGKTWIQAKTQAECYDYLFESAVRMRALGIDASKPPPAPRVLAPNGHAAAEVQHANGHAAKKLKTGHSQPLPTAIVLDIEGTVAPISFVADVMFPYARQHVRQHLTDTYDSHETRADVMGIMQQALADTPCARFPDPATAAKPDVIDAAVAWVELAIAADRKIPALKTLQGHIWRAGFEGGAMRAELFADVAPALRAWAGRGLKTYTYSSGSREAQRLFFGYSQEGNLRPHLCGYFDTSSGPKTEAGSYGNIALSLGVDSPSEILFATDSVPEAVAATKAGWRVVILDRPGNKPLPAGHGFKVITSMAELLE